MIRSEQAHVQVIARTHPGMAGKNNEDRYAVSAYRLSASDSTPALLAVLADGIGGHRAGEVAAELAVEAITQIVAASDGSRPIETLQEAIRQASLRIQERAYGDANRQGMGSTCACAWIIGRRLYSASVGDSRIYLVRGEQIVQLTTDHTWIQEALDKGALRPEQVPGHPNAHVIRRYLGSPTPPEVDFRLRLHAGESDQQAAGNQGFPLLEGDLLLICTDGLTDLVHDEEILAALRSQPYAGAAQALVDLANSRGGHDNITLLLLDVPQESAPRPVPRRRRWPWVAAGCLALMTVVVVVGLLWFSLGLLGQRLLPTATPGLTPTAAAPLPTALSPGLLLPAYPTPGSAATLPPPGYPYPAATSSLSPTSTP